MPRRRLTVDEHVVRQCPNSKLIKQDGRVVGVFSEAFRNRPGERYLSGTWLEYFGGSRQDRLLGVVGALRAMPREVKKKDGLIVLNVGRLEACGKARVATVKCWHEPKPENRAYAAIRGLPADNSDDNLLDLIAEGTEKDDIVIVQDLEPPTVPDARC